MGAAADFLAALSSLPLTEEEFVRRIVRAAVRETPGPYRVGLALREWQRIKAELAEAELAAMAAHYGAE